MGLKEIIVILLSYFIGCFNTGYYYTRLVYHKDIRSIGTNVTGALNVSRLAGKKGFLITFLGDAGKGALIVWLCRILQFSDTVTMVCIFMVLAGHIFPFQLKFHGGKGISTIFGALLVFHPMLVVYLGLICLILLPFVQPSTVASLFALLILPIVLYFRNYSWQMIGFAVLYALVINYACRWNWKDYISKKGHRNNKKDKLS